VITIHQRQRRTDRRTTAIARPRFAVKCIAQQKHQINAGVTFHYDRFINQFISVTAMLDHIGYDRIRGVGDSHSPGIHGRFLAPAKDSRPLHPRRTRRFYSQRCYGSRESSAAKSSVLRHIANTTNIQTTVTVNTTGTNTSLVKLLTLQLVLYTCTFNRLGVCKLSFKKVVIRGYSTWK